MPAGPEDTEVSGLSPIFSGNGRIRRYLQASPSPALLFRGWQKDFRRLSRRREAGKGGLRGGAGKAERAGPETGFPPDFRLLCT